MGTFAFVGLQGRGKTFWMLYCGIHYAMRYSRRLVLNFNINLDNLLDYAIANNYYHLYLMIKHGDILYIPDNIEYLFSIPNSVILLDEAPLYFGDSAGGSKGVTHLVAWLNQMRRNNCDLFLVCQALDRLQKLARDLVDVVIFCDSHCKKGINGNPEMLQFNASCFEPLEKFERWFTSSKRGKFFYDMSQRYNKFCLGFPLGISSYYINFLDVFDSYSNITTDENRIGNWWHYIRVEMIVEKSNKIFISEQKNLVKISEGEYFFGNLFKWEFENFYFEGYRKSWLVRLDRYFSKMKQPINSSDYISLNLRNKLIAERKEFNWEYPLNLAFFHKGRAGKDKDSPIDIKIYQSFYIYEWPKKLTFGYALSCKLAHFFSNLFNESLGNFLNLLKNSSFFRFPVFSGNSFFFNDYCLKFFNRKIGLKKIPNL